jgi:hypothetical protein
LEQIECRKKGLRYPELHGLPGDAQAKKSGQQGHYENMPARIRLHIQTLPYLFAARFRIGLKYCNQILESRIGC